MKKSTLQNERGTLLDLIHELRKKNAQLRKESKMNQDLVTRMCLRDHESFVRRKEIVRKEKVVSDKENCGNCKHRDMAPTFRNCERCINGGDGWESVKETPTCYNCRRYKEEKADCAKDGICGTGWMTIILKKGKKK